MALLTLTGVRKNFGAEVIFEDVTFTVHEGDRLGVVGPNGAGKTTLFRLILGVNGDDSAPDAGLVSRTRDVSIGHLPQQPDLGPERTVLAETLTALDGVRTLEKRLRELETEMEATHDPVAGHALAEEHGHVHEKFERAGGYRLESGALTVLAGLGVPEALLDRPCGVLSGGERSRVALAKMLLQAPDLMLLDEPTNHLDIEGTEWLEDFLIHASNAFLVTSHDRTFLDRVTTKTLEVADGAVKLWPGAYAAFEMLKAESLKALLREIDKQQDFLDKERAFIRKHLGSQRSREARGREKRLARFEILAKPPTAQQAARLDLSPARPQGNLPLTVEGVTATAGAQTLFRDLSFELLPGDRLGIVGRNGSGKSTLLRLLAGRTRPETGRIDLGRAIDLGWFDQEHALLDRTKTVYSTIHDYKPRWGDFEVRSWLARFNFFAAEAERGVDLLSGGERARLALARLVLDRPNVLFLDEPTNHLDIPSRQALEDALQTFTGTLIIVSHDRWFLDRIVTKILWIDPAGTRLYHGNYREAAARRRADRDAGREAVQRAKAAKLAPRTTDPPREATAKARKRRPLATIEAEIMKLEREKSELMSKLEDPTIYGDGTRVRDINERLGKVTASLATVEAEWQEYGS